MIICSLFSVDIIPFQMPKLEDLGAVGQFDSGATEFNMQVFQDIIFILLLVKILNTQK